jgi:predicted transcriptional regulator
MATNAHTPQPPETRIALRLPAELHRDLRAAAERNDRSVSAEARRAIAEHVGADQGRAAA